MKLAAITKLQTALKDVNTEIRNTQSPLKVVEKLQNVGGTIESAGKKMLLVTATVTAFGTASEMENLTVKAREMGFKTKFSASEAAEAMNYMAMVGKVISAIGTIMTIVPKVSGVINVVKGFYSDRRGQEGLALIWKLR